MEQGSTLQLQRRNESRSSLAGLAARCVSFYQKPIYLGTEQQASIACPKAGQSGNRTYQHLRTASLSLRRTALACTGPLKLDAPFPLCRQVGKSRDVPKNELLVL
eukprot:scaffold88125_cov36-Phaeocystis_antarctica.AAC.1